LDVGHTDDLKTRQRTHNEGRGGTYTAQRKPCALSIRRNSQLSEKRGIASDS